MGDPSSDLRDPPHIRKAFLLLKSHASSVATFTLQWQDLEDHLRSIANSIQAHLHHLPNSTPAAVAVAGGGGGDDLSPLPNPSAAVVKAAPDVEGDKLAKLLRDRKKNRDDVYRRELCDALVAESTPGRMVLRAVSELRRPDPKALSGLAVDYELNALRKNFVALVEEFRRRKPKIGGVVREEAVKVAKEWRQRITLDVDNSPEILGFVMVLDVFGLVGEFEEADVLNLMANIVMRKQAMGLFQSLGLSDKASDFITILISINKIVDAIRFIQAFRLADKFPPVQLIQNHVDEIKKVTENSSKKDDAMKKEIAALRVVVRSIADHKLNFSPENIEDRIKFLLDRRGVNVRPNPNPPKPDSNKRRNPQTLAPPTTRNPHFRNKHPLTGPPTRANTAIPPAREYSTASPMHHMPPFNLPERRGAEYWEGARPAMEAHTMYRRPLGFLEGEAARYSAEAAPRFQPSPPMPAQWPQYSPGSTSMSSGFGLSNAFLSEDPRMSSARFGVMTSSISAERIRDLDERYGNGIPSPRVPSAYYPGDRLRVAGHRERPSPSSGGYEMLSQRNNFHM